MKTPPDDDFVPAGVDPPSWLAFEGRIQLRRFRSLLANIESCIARGDLASARVALDEARTLRPEASELSALETRLASYHPPVSGRDFHVWRRVIGGTSMLLAGVTLGFVVDSARRSDTAHRLRGNSAPTAMSAPAPAAIRENRRDVVPTPGPVQEVPVASPSRVNVATVPVAPPARSPVGESDRAPLQRQRLERAGRVGAPSMPPRELTASSAVPPSPSLAPPLVSLRVTSATATEGAPVSLTVTLAIPSGGVAPRVIVDWGDGTTQDIGIVPTARTVTHAYANAGAYTITASARPDGETGVSAPPASTVTGSPNAATVNADVRTDA